MPRHSMRAAVGAGRCARHAVGARATPRVCSLPTRLSISNSGSRSLMPFNVTRLNHAVLFVRDADIAADFYHRVFGFEELERSPGMRAAFMRAPGGENHHDLGLFEVGAAAPRPPRGSVGLYHLAWEVATIEDLATAQQALAEAGALSGASDHGVSKSLYGRDPDGNEFEIMWRVPREAWGEFENQATVLPLDLERELARWGVGASVQ